MGAGAAGRQAQKSTAKKQRHALLPIVAKRAARLSWYLRYRALHTYMYSYTSASSLR
jgi:hypothetical protein